MDKNVQKQKAESFHALHAGDDILVLGNPWDVVTARIFESERYQAIGTTSAGIAATLGYPDGQQIDLHEYLEVVRRIVRSVSIPVNVDFEAGFSTTAEGVAANALEVLRTGAVGINIEDENHSRAGGLILEPVPHMSAKIDAIRAVSRDYGVPLFINAKTDAVWLTYGGDLESAMTEAILRANAYAAAGADCVFVTGDFDLEEVRRLRREIPHTMNIVIKSKTPPVAELRALGVKRLSMGSGPMRAALGATREVAREAIRSGTYEACLRLGIPYYDVKGMLAS
jgi:2-methylisocitrate lyase-like PEP mutase family enzyme